MTFVEFCAMIYSVLLLISTTSKFSKRVMYMTAAFKRFLSAALALLMLLALPLGALAQELPAPGGETEPGAGLLEITVPDYTPGADLQLGNVSEVRKGGRYTLIVLPSSSKTTSGSQPKPLTADLLLSCDPLFIGSAIADADGHVTFTGIRLRTAEAAVYYVTGPNLTTPLAEATSRSVTVSGKVLSGNKGVENATVSVVDSATGYAYANTARTYNGTYTFSSIAPGSYNFQVNKPGYLPAVIQEKITVSDDASTILTDFDYSPYLGDLNNDGKRDLADLTDFLTYYKAASLPVSLTLDLNGDSAIDQHDLSLFLTAAGLGGTGVPSGSAALVAQDNGADSLTNRTLSFSLDNGGVNGLTFTAAHISLTFRSDYVQPINSSGGVIYPTSASTTANCLVPKPGVTLSNIRWTLNGDLTTLDFSASCARPTALTGLVDFLYRPAPGKTVSDFFDGVFAVPHAAAQVGGSGLLEACALTYPGSQAQSYAGLTISADPQAVTIPATGRTAVSSLSVTGVPHGESEAVPVKGVTWSMTGDTQGVSISGDLLTVTSDAKPGDIILTAWKNGVESASYTITLKNAPSVPTSLVIYGPNGSNSQPITQFTHVVDGDRPAAQILLAAAVLDQYGAVMADQIITWSLSGAPAAIRVDSTSNSSAEVVVNGQTLPSGSYDFSLHAACGSLQASCAITVQRIWPLVRLTISGPSAAQIPAAGAGTLTLRYAISAIDGSGASMSASDLSLRFTVDGDHPGVTFNRSMDGDCTVTIDPSAQAGALTLRATDDDSSVSTTFTLTLKAAPDQSAVSDPVRAAISFEGEFVNSLDFTFGSDPNSYEDWTHIPFLLVLLNQDGAQVSPTKQSWKLETSDFNLLNAAIAAGQPYTGLLTFVHNKPGRQFYTLTALEEISGLSIQIPVTALFLPELQTLTLNVPDSLAIPTSGAVDCTLPLNATDIYGDPMSLPANLVWTVTDSQGKAPAGVTLQSGVLTVTSSAAPGDLQITASCGDVKATATLELTSSSSQGETVLALRRNGELLSGGVDAAYGKEGAPITLSYEPVLVDQANGAVEVLPSTEVTWVGAQGSFSIDKSAEPGTYSAPITAIYNGQSISLTAQITVYPDITAIYADFGADDANSANNAYRFTVPATSPKTYRGVVMASIRRGGKTQSVPLSSLTIPDYQLEFYTYLTGVYLAYDYATGQLSLTIDPAAATNSMDPPAAGSSDSRYVGVEFSYYPGQDPYAAAQSFILTPEPLQLTTAILRQGAGSGSKFVFESAPEETAIEASPGVLSHCYALELLDQYGNPITDHYVAWTLTGAPTGSAGTPLVSMIDPGEAIANNYPRYQSLRRLRVNPEAQEGEYQLTLTAACGPTADAAKNDPTFSRSIAITLTVSGVRELQSVTLTGPTSSVIPKYYNSYNRPVSVNTDVRTVTYVAAAQGPDGSEVDPDLCSFQWTVTDPSGSSADGVTIRPGVILTPNEKNPSILEEEKNPAAATVVITNAAHPTAKDAPLQVGVTVTPKGGGSSSGSSSSLDLTLYRSSLVPALLTIQGGPTSFTLEKDDAPVTATYTFTMVDQYNDPAPDRDCSKVEWSMAGGGNVVTKTNITQNGYPAVKLTVTPKNTDVRGTITLRAAITFTNASSPSGKTTVYQDLSIPYVIGNPPIGGGDGLLLPEEADPTVQTISPKVSQSGTTGSVSLSEEEANALIASTVSGTLTIAPSGGNGLTSITVTLPSDVTKSMAGKNQSLRLQTSLGTLTIPVKALSALNSAGGKSISITILNQDNTLSVSFRANNRAVSLGALVTLQAPVKGNVVLKEENGVQTLQKKLAIANGQLTTLIGGDVQFKLDTRGKTFSDTQSHWAKDAVIFVTARDLFQGTSETTFSPSGDMTRGMVVTVLHRLEDLPSSSAANIFRDVPNGTWYTDGVVWANEQGIVQGNGDGFLPDDPVTREQLVTILYRYMNKLGLATNRRSSLTPFSDSAQVSPWAKDAMEWAVAAGLVTGKTGGLLDPGGKASRAEVATIIERLVRAMAPSV